MNTTPVANDDDLYEVYENQVLRVNGSSGVLNNDTDADSDALRAHVTASTKNPLFQLKTTGAFTYDARYPGQLYVDSSYYLTDDTTETSLPDGFDSLAAGAIVYDTFTYRAHDGQASDTAVATIKITGVNDDPVAADDLNNSVNGGQTVTIDVLANDTDPDIFPTPDTLSVVALSDIADEPGAPGGTDNTPGDGLTITTKEGGTVELVNGQIEYTAAAGFFGIDTFEYTVSDGNGGTDTAVIRVTVLPANTGPTAINDLYSVGEGDGETDFTGDDSVLANDTDPEETIIGAFLSVALYASDSSGDALPDPGPGEDPHPLGILTDFNADGSFSYDPNGEFGSLSLGQSAYVAFKYKAFDGNGEVYEAVAVIEIEGENGDPTGVSPDAVDVYEAGLDTGSGDGSTIIQRDIDITISDPDAGDTPYLVGNTTDPTTETDDLTGLYGTLSFLDADTVRYVLTSAADHAAVQGHNGGIQDTFTVYVSDGNGGYSQGLTVTVNVIDDINFIEILPNDGGVGDPVDDTSVAFKAFNPANQDTSDDGEDGQIEDSFTLIPGADGQTLGLVGLPEDFTLYSYVDGNGQTVNGPTISSSWSFDDATGIITVMGKDGQGNTFYTLTIDPDPDGDPETLLGEYQFTMAQSIPVITNPLDFSSVKAGGPKENLTVEGITFNGMFFTNRADLRGSASDSATSSDDVNPNNAGGIGIGNGNIDKWEVLEIKTNDQPVSGVKLEMTGVGGGVGVVDILWEAWAYDANNILQLVDTGTIGGVNMAQKAPNLLQISPDQDFDVLYVAVDPNTIDSNDTIRINNISTIQEITIDSFELNFQIASADGDGDWSPLDAEDAPDHVAFSVTVEGTSGSTTVVDAVDPGDADVLLFV